MRYALKIRRTLQLALAIFALSTMIHCGGSGSSSQSSGPSTPDGWSFLSTSFDGVDEEATAPAINTIMGTSTISTFTISFWMKMPVDPGNSDGILGNVTNNAWSDGFGFYTETLNDGLSFFINHFNNPVVTATNVSSGVWHHVVGVYDRGAVSENLRIYINGVVQDVADYNAADLEIPLSSMQFGRLGSNYSNVQLDEVAIWATALTDDEIAEIYYAGVPESLLVDTGDYVSATSLRAYWLMGESLTFPTITDIVGGHTATMTNMEVVDFLVDAP